MGKLSMLLSLSHTNTFYLHLDPKDKTQEAAFIQETCDKLIQSWRQHGFIFKPVERTPTLLQLAGTLRIHNKRKHMEPSNMTVSTHNQVVTSTAHHNPGC